jgi:hypothetical protein
MSNVYYHGCNDAAPVLEALLGAGKLRHGFHMAVDKRVASNYGKQVIRIELEADVEGAHVGLINKVNNFNRAVGNGIEVVLKTQQAVNSLYYNLIDAEVIH